MPARLRTGTAPGPAFSTRGPPARRVQVRIDLGRGRIIWPRKQGAWPALSCFNPASFGGFKLCCQKVEIRRVLVRRDLASGPCADLRSMQPANPEASVACRRRFSFCVHSRRARAMCVVASESKDVGPHKSQSSGLGEIPHNLAIVFSECGPTRHRGLVRNETAATGANCSQP